MASTTYYYPLTRVNDARDRAERQSCRLLLLAAQELLVSLYHRLVKTALFQLVAAHHNQRGESITVMAVKQIPFGILNEQSIPSTAGDHCVSPSPYEVCLFLWLSHVIPPRRSRYSGAYTKRKNVAADVASKGLERLTSRSAPFRRCIIWFCAANSHL